jgi:hypothetical protein
LAALVLSDHFYASTDIVIRLYFASASVLKWNNDFVFNLPTYSFDGLWYFVIHLLIVKWGDMEVRKQWFSFVSSLWTTFLWRKLTYVYIHIHQFLQAREWWIIARIHCDLPIAAWALERRFWFSGEYDNPEDCSLSVHSENLEAWHVYCSQSISYHW